MDGLSLGAQAGEKEEEGGSPFEDATEDPAHGGATGKACISGVALAYRAPGSVGVSVHLARYFSSYCASWAEVSERWREESVTLCISLIVSISCDTGGGEIPEGRVVDIPEGRESSVLSGAEIPEGELTWDRGGGLTLGLGVNLNLGFARSGFGLTTAGSQ